MKTTQDVREYAGTLGIGVDLRHRGRHAAAGFRHRGGEVYLLADVVLNAAEDHGCGGDGRGGLSRRLSRWMETRGSTGRCSLASLLPSSARSAATCRKTRFVLFYGSYVSGLTSFERPLEPTCGTS